MNPLQVGDYKRALTEYEAVSKKSKPPKEVNICLACTYFYLGMYQEAEKAGDKAEKDRLSTRVRFHLSHKFGDEKKLMTFHQGKSYAQYLPCDLFTKWFHELPIPNSEFLRIFIHPNGMSLVCLVVVSQNTTLKYQINKLNSDQK